MTLQEVKAEIAALRQSFNEPVGLVHPGRDDVGERLQASKRLRELMLLEIDLSLDIGEP